MSEKAPYVLLSGRHSERLENGNRVIRGPGETVHLTPSQAEAFGDKVIAQVEYDAAQEASEAAAEAHREAKLEEAKKAVVADKATKAAAKKVVAKKTTAKKVARKSTTSRK